jgi:hypothetical protein
MAHVSPRRRCFSAAIASSRQCDVASNKPKEKANAEKLAAKRAHRHIAIA